MPFSLKNSKRSLVSGVGYHNGIRTLENSVTKIINHDIGNFHLTSYQIAIITIQILRFLYLKGFMMYQLKRANLRCTGRVLFEVSV